MLHELALDRPRQCKIPLDKVVNTMWETAKDMKHQNKRKPSERRTRRRGILVIVSQQFYQFKQW